MGDFHKNKLDREAFSGVLVFQFSDDALTCLSQLYHAEIIFYMDRVGR